MALYERVTSLWGHCTVCDALTVFKQLWGIDASQLLAECEQAGVVTRVDRDSYKF